MNKTRDLAKFSGTDRDRLLLLTLAATLASEHASRELVLALLYIAM